LPTGVKLGADGALAGTPRAAGVFRATVTLSDNEGRTLDHALSFGVAERLAVSTLALKPGKVGRLYRAKLASTGGLPPKKWKVLTGPLPKGIRFTPALGTLSGTPTKAGSYRVDLPGRGRPQGRREEDVAHRRRSVVASASISSGCTSPTGSATSRTSRPR
jgi:hypothetical protein